MSRKQFVDRPSDDKASVNGRFSSPGLRFNSQMYDDEDNIFATNTDDWSTQVGEPTFKDVDAMAGNLVDVIM